MKFSIRDLLLITVIVALAAGWWVDRQRLRGEAEKARQDADAYFSELTKISPPPTMPPPSR